jgi:AcrR family transcriptional regulator
VSGASERTVYRYFPTKQALLDAWWASHKNRIGQEHFPDTAEALAAFPLKAFPAFDSEAQVIRGAVLSAQGRAMTLARNHERQTAIRTAVVTEVGDRPEGEIVAICAVVQLLQSATAWLTMRDYWNLDGHTSAKAAHQAINAIFKSARGGAFKE